MLIGNWSTHKNRLSNSVPPPNPFPLEWKLEGVKDGENEGDDCDMFCENIMNLKKFTIIIIGKLREQLFPKEKS